MGYEIIVFTVLNLCTPDNKTPQQSTSIPACVNFGFYQTSACLNSRYAEKSSLCQEWNG